MDSAQKAKRFIMQKYSNIQIPIMGLLATPFLQEIRNQKCNTINWAQEQLMIFLPKIKLFTQLIESTQSYLLQLEVILNSQMFETHN